MASFIEILAAQAASERVSVTPELDQALRELDEEMERLCPQLQVEYIGPGVGMADHRAEHVYRLVVREHTWDVFTCAWGLKVCDALDNCEFRPMWPLQGTARLRKQHIVKSLPGFFTGFMQAVQAAGKADTPAGQQLQGLAARFSPSATA